ncbi:T9SS type A sorting domain-containing protein [Polaribacter sp.]|uniref:T9SS type A sorting domain-containing protein n=1 Tax=Polaribacter sp. TaxID=1920175 RepID=UPI003EF4C037
MISNNILLDNSYFSLTKNNFEKVKSVSLDTLDGKHLLSFSNKNILDNKCNLGNLSNGIYLIIINTNQVVISKHLIKN